MGVGAGWMVLAGSGGLLSLVVASPSGSSAFGSSMAASWGSGGKGMIGSDGG